MEVKQGRKKKTNGTTEENMETKGMRTSRMVIASDCKCQSTNCPGFDPSSSDPAESKGAADKAVLNLRKIQKKLLVIC